MALCRAQHHQRCSHPTKCVNGSLFSHQEATDARNHGCQGPSMRNEQGVGRTGVSCSTRRTPTGRTSGSWWRLILLVISDPRSATLNRRGPLDPA